ncbi:MAG: hypothetical protein WAM60_23840, partial [Candidatus Promineifilaceae bacterium]
MTNKGYFFRWRILISLVVIAVFIAACGRNDETETPTAAVIEPTEETAATAEPTETVPEPTTAPTATTEEAAPTSTTESEAATEVPTLEAATATAEPTETETAEPTTEPVTAAPGTIAPGQQITGTLESGASQTFSFQAVALEPIMVFVEGDNALDMVLDAYTGADTAAAPLIQANNSPVGRPEVMVITPAEDGEQTLVVTANDDTAGTFTLYMYDDMTEAAGA